jgi:glycosyltransferase AglD
MRGESMPTAVDVPRKRANARRVAAKTTRTRSPKSARTDRRAPELSVVIPVYNEEAILEHQVRALVSELRTLKRPFEVLLSANGCVDDTVQIAQELMKELPELALLVSPEPNYGAALRLGIEAARGRFVLCDEIDLCDVDFHRRALRRLDHDECDMVVGSKAMPGSRDRRPATRRAATRVINGLLWATVGFQGTDTHGLKAFTRDALLPIVRSCVVDKDLFASELVIRAGRAGLRVHEIPIELEEQRSSPIHLLRRVPRVVKDLGRLVVAVRFRRKP